jgi:DNA polymerase-1
VRLVEERVGPRPVDAVTAAAARAGRDDAVRALVPGAEDVDLRNPASVRALLGRVGIDVPDTRAWRLEPFRGTHPLVAALIDWRQAERIATTYGFGWLDRDVGPDGRLRGSWTGCDGAAGRMTASAGLHNLPAELRPAVAAEPGMLLVRADLGQVEPRVLAAVSGDDALARATGDDDLYAPVAARLAVDRPTAKVAVLAAMYGQTSGAAGEALRGLERAYPGGDGLPAGRARVGGCRSRRHDVRRSAGPDVAAGRAGGPRGDGGPRPVRAQRRGAGRRRGAVQDVGGVGARGPAARSGGRALPARRAAGARTRAGGRRGRRPAARRAGLDRRAVGAGSGVRFVADVSVVRRWSDAKG